MVGALAYRFGPALEEESENVEIFFEEYDLEIEEAEAEIARLKRAADRRDPATLDALAWAYYQRHTLSNDAYSETVIVTPWLCDAINSWAHAAAGDHEFAQLQLGMTYYLATDLPEPSPTNTYFWAQVAALTMETAGTRVLETVEYLRDSAQEELTQPDVERINLAAIAWHQAKWARRVELSTPMVTCTPNDEDAN